MPTIAIGDIHGNHAALDDLLTQIERQTDQRDTVVFLGDYIDRGPDSKRCLDRILKFRREVPARVVCLLGNHEQWLLRTLEDFTRHSWLLAMEAFPTIQSYSIDAAGTLRDAATTAGASLVLARTPLPYDAFFEHLPPAHLSFLRALAPSFQSHDGVFVHGGLDPHVSDLENQTVQDLVWGTAAFPEKYAGSNVVVYGHRDNAELDGNGWPGPRIVGQTIGVDTISHGVLTAIRLPDRKVFQSARHRSE